MAARKPAKNNCRLHCCNVDDELAEKIRNDARSGTNWASEEITGGWGVTPVCRCAVPQKGSFSVHGVDDGTCPKHPKENR